MATRLILLNVRTFVNILENEKNEELEDRAELQKTRKRIRKAIRMAPPANDYVSECCRLTALIMMKAEETSQPLRVAVEDTTYLDELRFALQQTDTENLWAEHIGLLFWVIVISNAAAFHTSHHLFTTTILTNLMFEACYSDYDLDVALVPLEKMIWFEGYCKSGQSVLPLR